MTLYTTQILQVYAGPVYTGTNCSIPFKFLDDDYIQAEVYDADGVKQGNTWVLGSDFSLIGAMADEGGSLIPLMAGQINPGGGSVGVIKVPAGQYLFIYRQVPITQGTDLQNVDKFDTATYENALDKVTMILQQFRSELDRTVRLPITVAAADWELKATPVPNRALKWNADGTALVNTDVPIEDAATLAAASATEAEAARDIAVNAAANVAILNLPNIVGHGLSFIRAKSDETGGEFRTPAQVFSDIGMPSAVGHGGHYIRQNAGVTGLEYATPAQIKSDIGIVWGDVGSKPDILVRPDISFISKCGINSCFMIIDGKLYSTTGNTQRTQYTTGRGYNNNAFPGIENFKEVVIPSSSPIVKAGGGYCNAVAWALLANNALYTWGFNPEGQCGLGHTTRVDIPTLAATNVVDVYDDPTNALSLSNYSKLIIKKTDGYLYTTGYNGYGQLGLGNTTDRNTFTQITDLGNSIKSVFNLGASIGVTIVQKNDDTIWGCGTNGNGQLGLGNATQQNSFVNITSAWGGGTGYILKQALYSSMWSGSASGHRCVLGLLLDNGTTTVFKTCGYNGTSCLGDGTTTERNTPVTPNVGAGRIAKIACFGAYVPVIQVLKEDGNLYAWGYNAYGAVGDGTTTERATPAIVATNVLDIYSHGVHDYNSTTYQSFIKKSTGYYSCGYNARGQCGLGNITTPITSFTKMLLPADADIKYLGSFFTESDYPTYIAITTSNKGYVWGNNTYNGISTANALNVWVPTKFNIPGGN